MLEHYITIIDPWIVDVSAALNATADKRRELWMDVGDTHYTNIEKAAMMIALLDQEPPDNGTVSEVAWAAAHGKPVIGYRNDVRTAGETGMPYNLMIGAAIRRSGGLTVNSLAELEKQLQNPTAKALQRVLNG